MDTQRLTDRIVSKTLLWMIPRSVRPNHLTIVRLLLIPIILALMILDLRVWAFVLFVLTACTDFVDGAMARTRDQITALGMVLDPIADKLLIGTVLAWVGYKDNWHFTESTFLNTVIPFVVAFIALELIVTAVGMGAAQKGKRARSANLFGKTKMIAQSLAVVLFLIAGIFDLHNLLVFSLYLMWIAVALAVISGATQVYGYLKG